MADVKRQALLSTLREFGGRANCIVVPKAFVKFTGSLEAAMLFSQLLYWSEKNNSNRVYNTDAEFQEELSLSRRAVRQARSDLERKGLIKTEIHRANGSPTTHYYLQEDEIEKQWSDWIVPFGTMENTEWDNPKSQMEQSLTKTSTKTSTNNSSVSAKPAEPATPKVQFVPKSIIDTEDTKEPTKKWEPRTEWAKYLAENARYGRSHWEGFASSKQREEWETLESTHRDDFKGAIEWAIKQRIRKGWIVERIMKAVESKHPVKDDGGKAIIASDGGIYL